MRWWSGEKGDRAGAGDRADAANGSAVRRPVSEAGGGPAQRLIGDGPASVLAAGLLGRAQVVVGARSAVFAPMPNLGMIVVDEEHDASYKQDQAPRYHGRDVAIKRAQFEGVPVMLGARRRRWRRGTRVEPLPEAQARWADRSNERPGPGGTTVACASG